MAKGGGKSKGYSANDMRSMALNQTSSHYQAAQANRANQLNPQHAAYEASRGQQAVGGGDTGRTSEKPAEEGQRRDATKE